MNKNDLVTARLEAVSYGGNAIARVDKMVVFVPRGVAGDLCELRILKVQKSFAFAKIENIIAPSPDRADHFCRYGGKCGCCFADFGYDTELKYKKSFVKDALLKIAGVDLPVCDVLPSPKVTAYRNKVQFPVSKENEELKIGFYRSRSHSVIDIDRCPLHNEVFDAVIPVFRKWITDYNISVYDEKSCRGLIRHIGGKTGVKSGETVIIIVATKESVPHTDKLTKALTEAIPSLSGIVLNVNSKPGNEILGDRSVCLYGKEKLTEFIGDLKFNVSTLSFFQINPYQVERLYSKALELADPTKEDVLLDLCSGTGTITQFFARHVKKAVGIEIVPDAVKDAKENAALNGLDNCEFICGEAGEVSDRLLSEGFSPSIITLDPARKGLSEFAITTVSKFMPKKIVYISCDPTTQARDLKILLEKGYEITAVCPVDMFPRTYHVESVVGLRRK
ncbi:MAG: 23S rRNA (uracil(1939)-C(5))-methyltransferase RlmD [Clostridia bacterium]|nr:23S rRNA (uracil(1939)-C(5))-methyltransferase RlmD [Clostridia bacterium]